MTKGQFCLFFSQFIEFLAFFLLVCLFESLFEFFLFHHSHNPSPLFAGSAYPKMLAAPTLFTSGLVTYFLLRTKRYSFILKYLSFWTNIYIPFFIVTKVFDTIRPHIRFLVLFLCLPSARHYYLHIFRHLLYIFKTEIPGIAYYLCRRSPQGLCTLFHLR